jgi:hypothetical protein
MELNELPGERLVSDFELLWRWQERLRQSTRLQVAAPTSYLEF